MTYGGHTFIYQFPDSEAHLAKEIILRDIWQGKISPLAGSILAEMCDV